MIRFVSEAEEDGERLRQERDRKAAQVRLHAVCVWYVARFTKSTERCIRHGFSIVASSTLMTPRSHTFVLCSGVFFVAHAEA
jgi:hypothetical protein